MGNFSRTTRNALRPFLILGTALFWGTACGDPLPGGDGSGISVGTVLESGDVATCTTNSFWIHGNSESPYMRPGGRCIHCHSVEDEGPTFTIAGTIFSSLNDVDDCNGVDGRDGTKVVITGADGKVVNIGVNRAGNFYWQGALEKPYKATIVSGDRSVSMVAGQTSGDCNNCHTVEGAEKAPGRIIFP